MTWSIWARHGGRLQRVPGQTFNNANKARNGVKKLQKNDTYVTLHVTDEEEVSVPWMSIDEWRIRDDDVDWTNNPP